MGYDRVVRSSEKKSVIHHCWGNVCNQPASGKEKPLRGPWSPPTHSQPSNTHKWTAVTKGEVENENSPQQQQEAQWPAQVLMQHIVSPLYGLQQPPNYTYTQFLL